MARVETGADQGSEELEELEDLQIKVEKSLAVGPVELAATAALVDPVPAEPVAPRTLWCSLGPSQPMPWTRR